MNFERYFAGLVLSALCTFAAFIAVESGALGLLHVSQLWIVIAIFALALIQIIVQLACFLHVNFKPESRARLVVLGGAFLVVCILLSGSLWIMISLRARMTPSTAQMEQYMNAQDGF